MALPAFERFTSDAVDELLAVIRTGDDSEERAKALMSLHKMVRTETLPPGKFRSVVDAVGTCLVGTATPRVWCAALELAVETGDSQLHVIVAGVASGLAQPGFPDRPDLHLWARAIAKRLLSRYHATRAVRTPDPDQPGDCGDGGCPKLAG